MLRRNSEQLLNGEWLFIPDKADVGGERGYMLPNTPTDLWRIANVPCTFERAAPETEGYRGTMWFRRTFRAEVKKNSLVWLEFGAVNYRADVWVNGSLAGSAKGGYLPFRFEISKLLLPSGENTLCVRVNNSRVHGILPNNHFWRGHGGIIRSVKLIYTPVCKINSVKVSKAGNILRICANIENHGENAITATLMHKVAENGNRISETFSVGGKSRAEVCAEIPVCDFKPWSPDDPVCYTLETTITGNLCFDRVTQTFGVREIKVKDGKLLLNGEEIAFRGFNRHEDTCEADIATDEVGAEADFRAIKAMGANFVRFCHYPHSEEELDLCDRLGLAVFAEIPFNATLSDNKEYNDAESKKAFPQMYSAARGFAEGMVERDYNHPCIMFWSAGNETNEADACVREANDALVQYLKSLDPSRLAVHVSQGKFWDGTLAVDEPLFTYDDVICVNAYVTAERRGAELGEKDYAAAREFWDEHLAKFAKLYPDKPVFVTEFGYQTDLPRDGIRAEEAQAETLLCDIAAMEGRVAGYSIWHYSDHAWEISEDGSVFFGSTVSPFGVVTRNRTPKAAVKALSEYWNGLK